MQPEGFLGSESLVSAQPHPPSLCLLPLESLCPSQVLISSQVRDSTREEEDEEEDEDAFLLSELRACLLCGLSLIPRTTSFINLWFGGSSCEGQSSDWQQITLSVGVHFLEHRKQNLRVGPLPWCPPQILPRSRRGSSHLCLSPSPEGNRHILWPL